MAEKNKNSGTFDDLKWWNPSKTEHVMLALTVVTVLISAVSQANLFVGNILQFDAVYKQLYPILNIFHIYLLVHIILSLPDIKKSILPVEKDKEGYPAYKIKLKQWMKTHFGSIYWKDKKDKDFNEYVDDLITNTNRNIIKTHRYFFMAFACFVLLYIVELVNSFTSTVNEPVLHILTIIFNNAATLFWFYIYLTLNVYKKPAKKIEQKDKEAEKKKMSYKARRFFYRFWMWITFSRKFGRPDKYEQYEGNKSKKYKSIEFYRTRNWELYGLIFLMITTVLFICFIGYFEAENISNMDDIIYKNGCYYFFRTLSAISILLGGGAMLAIFSRLSSGFKRVPLSAFLLMLLYAAIQPLFYTYNAFESSSMKLGQMMFITNLLMLIGKFGLLYLIKWFFANYHITYYFISEQIIKDKKDVINIKDLFSKKKRIGYKRRIKNRLSAYNG